MRIAITGSNGFIGSHLQPYLTQHLQADIISITRTSKTPLQHNNLSFSLTDNELTTQLRKNTNCMIHLAARAHTNRSSNEDFQRDNVVLSQRVGKLCVAAEIPRLIYISSVKVNGNMTHKKPFSADEAPSPTDAYGQSKWDAERHLQKMTAGTKTQLIIIRPPLVYTNNVYGGDNKGNIKILEIWVKNGIPLPFSGINNRRDLVSIENLCSLISTVAVHPSAPNHIFLVSDGISRSTQDIVQLVSKNSRLKAKFFTVPNWLFLSLKKISPLRNKIESLMGNLEVDISKTQSMLGWSPKP
jgi:UDP-glucose 4-epimerase